MLITILGIDGAGKTTSGKLLERNFRTMGINAKYVKLIFNDSHFVVSIWWFLMNLAICH